MSDLLPCPFCGGTNIGLLRHFSYYPHDVMCRHCSAAATNVESWNTRAIPAVRPNAAAIRKAALQEAADVPGSWARTWKRKAERTEGLESDGWAEGAQTCFDLEAEILALIDNPPHVNETPKTEHDREDVLTPDATAIREAARAPMHQLSPAEHAAMGWSHGQYRDGYCLALMAHGTPKEVAAFKAEAKERGAEYVALFNLPEYLG